MLLAFLNGVSEPDGLPALGSKYCISVQTSGSQAKGWSHSEHRQSLASWSPSTSNMASRTSEETQIVFPKSCRDAGKGVSRPQCKAAPCCLLALLGQVPLFPSGYTGQKEAQLEIPPGRENQISSRSTVPASTLAPTLTCGGTSGKLMNLPGPQIAHR